MLPRRRKQQLQPAMAPSKMDVLSPTQLDVRVGLMPTKSARRPIPSMAPPAEPTPLSLSQPNVRVGFLPSYSFASDTPAQSAAPAMVPLPLSHSFAPPTTNVPPKKRKQQHQKQHGPIGLPTSSNALSAPSTPYYEPAATSASDPLVAPPPMAQKKSRAGRSSKPSATLTPPDNLKERAHYHARREAERAKERAFERERDRVRAHLSSVTLHTPLPDPGPAQATAAAAAAPQTPLPFTTPTPAPPQIHIPPPPSALPPPAQAPAPQTSTSIWGHIFGPGLSFRRSAEVPAYQLDETPAEPLVARSSSLAASTSPVTPNRRNSSFRRAAAFSDPVTRVPSPQRLSGATRRGSSNQATRPSRPAGRSARRHSVPRSATVSVPIRATRRTLAPSSLPTSAGRSDVPATSGSPPTGTAVAQIPATSQPLTTHWSPVNISSAASRRPEFRSHQAWRTRRNVWDDIEPQLHAIAQAEAFEAQQTAQEQGISMLHAQQQIQLAAPACTREPPPAWHPRSPPPAFVSDLSDVSDLESASFEGTAQSVLSIDTHMARTASASSSASERSGQSSSSDESEVSLRLLSPERRAWEADRRAGLTLEQRIANELVRSQQRIKRNHLQSNLVMNAQSLRPDHEARHLDQRQPGDDLCLVPTIQPSLTRPRRVRSPAPPGAFIIDPPSDEETESYYVAEHAPMGTVVNMTSASEAVEGPGIEYRGRR